MLVEFADLIVRLTFFFFRLFLKRCLSLGFLLVFVSLISCLFESWILLPVTSDDKLKVEVLSARRSLASLPGIFVV